MSYEADLQALTKRMGVRPPEVAPPPPTGLAEVRKAVMQTLPQGSVDPPPSPTPQTAPGRRRLFPNARPSVHPEVLANARLDHANAQRLLAEQRLKVAEATEKAILRLAEDESAFVVNINEAPALDLIDALTESERVAELQRELEAERNARILAERAAVKVEATR